VRVVLLGPPGAGKGTQAQIIAERLGVPAISTCDIFRANVSGKTELGQKAKIYMDAGNLVPDEITVAMVKDRLAETDAKGGFLLDGFPRTIGQAEALDEYLAARGAALDAACCLKVPDDELWRRLRGRGRGDDQEGVIRHRLAVWTSQTRPVLAYYRDRGRLVVVDAVGSPEVIAERILSRVAALADGPAGRR
jgi:adenylate kinase